MWHLNKRHTARQHKIRRVQKLGRPPESKRSDWPRGIDRNLRCRGVWWRSWLCLWIRCETAPRAPDKHRIACASKAKILPFTPSTVLCVVFAAAKAQETSPIPIGPPFAALQYTRARDVVNTTARRFLAIYKPRCWLLFAHHSTPLLIEEALALVSAARAFPSALTRPDFVVVSPAQTFAQAIRACTSSAFISTN